MGGNIIVVPSPFLSAVYVQCKSPPYNWVRVVSNLQSKSAIIIGHIGV